MTEVLPTTTPNMAVSLHPSTPWQMVAQAYLDAAIDSPNTRRAYQRSISEAMAITGVTSLDQLTGAQLAAYRAEITNAEGVSPSTMALKLAGVRSFLTWAGAMQAHVLPMEIIRTALKTPRSDVRKPYQVLSEQEIGRVLSIASTPRDKAIMAVLLGGGLRVSELVDLNVTDVVEDGDGNASLHVSSGKGRKSRTVPIQPDVTRAIRAYLDGTGRKLGQAGPIFRAHDRGATRRTRSRLTARSVAYLVTKLTKAAGIDAKRISPHSLRHSYALRTLRHSGNVVAVSKLLGHAQLTTTQRYVDHLAINELRQAVPELPVS